jgi:hypothetical protein
MKKSDRFFLFVASTDSVLSCSVAFFFEIVFVFAVLFLLSVLEFPTLEMSMTGNFRLRFERTCGHAHQLKILPFGTHNLKVKKQSVACPKQIYNVASRQSNTVSVRPQSCERKFVVADRALPALGSGRGHRRFYIQT